MKITHVIASVIIATGLLSGCAKEEAKTTTETIASSSSVADVQAASSAAAEVIEHDHAHDEAVPEGEATTAPEGTEAAPAPAQ